MRDADAKDLERRVVALEGPDRCIHCGASRPSKPCPVFGRVWQPLPHSWASHPIGNKYPDGIRYQPTGSVLTCSPSCRRAHGFEPHPFDVYAPGD